MTEIKTIEMHTGGEPLRIIIDGFPEVKGKTLMEKRRYVKENLDVWRRRLMLEPRGHSDMYGALVVQPDHPEADLAVLFMDNGGYSTMCGHATIALGRYIVDNKLNKGQPVPVSESVSNVPVVLQCPCGLVRTTVTVTNGKSGRLTFTSVPAFCVSLGFTLSTPSFGDIIIDVAYGGAFYALVNINQLGLSFESSSVAQITDAADEISTAVRSSGPELIHPSGDKDLSFLYGTILINEQDQPYSRDLCVFAEREVDRSPCGSGVTAQVAVQYTKCHMKQGKVKEFQNAKTKSVFTAEVAEVDPEGMVRVKVTGEAHYTGKSTFTFEEDDPLKDGFRLL